MTVLGFVLYGSLVLLPIMLQTLLGYPSMQAGIAMAPRGMGSLVMMPIVGFLTRKVDRAQAAGARLLVGGVTLIWLGQLNLQAGYWDIFWPQLLQGTGMALTVRAADDGGDGRPSRRSGWVTRRASST